MTGLSTRPGTLKYRTQHAVRDLVHEHRAAETLPTSGRFLLYELEQRGVVTKAEARHVTDALTLLRRLGEVPWSWIVDETRTVHDYTGHADLGSGLRTALDRLRLDPWDGRAPVVVCESLSLAGVLRHTVAEYRATVCAVRGQCAGFLHTDLAPLVAGDQRPVLYLGDHDISGGHIEDHTRRTMYEYTLLDDDVLDWRRVAITEAQIDTHGLRDLAIEKVDKRYRGGRRYLAWETEALGQELVVGLVREALDARLPEPIEAVRQREEAQRERLRSLLEGAA